MRDNTIILEGNVVRDVELQYSAAGNGYTRNAIAVERRRKDGDEWVSETSFLDFSILDDRLAENFCTSVSKGDRVLLVGDMRSRTVPDKDDPTVNRTFYGVVVDNIGPSLKWATASITKNDKKGAGSAPSTGGDFFDDRDGF